MYLLVKVLSRGKYLIIKNYQLTFVESSLCSGGDSFKIHPYNNLMSQFYPILSYLCGPRMRKELRNSLICGISPLWLAVSRRWTLRLKTRRERGRGGAKPGGAGRGSAHGGDGEGFPVALSGRHLGRMATTQVPRPPALEGTSRHQAEAQIMDPAV